MHNVFRLSDKRQRVADHLPTEIEAVAAARHVAARMAEMGRESEAGLGLFFKQLEAVSRAGLLGISVPSDYGGADMTNAVLADIVALLSESDAVLGESVKNHFQVVEALRLFGSQGQQTVYFAHALVGEHFALAPPLGVVSGPDRSSPTAQALPTLEVDRTGFCLSAPPMALHGGFCDWIAIPALDPKGAPVLALLARDAEDLHVSFSKAEAGKRAWFELSNSHVPADNLLLIGEGADAFSTLSALGQLLGSAVNLGRARGYFARLLSMRGNDAETLLMLGQMSAHMDGVAAMVERAGQHLDVAQVHPTEDSVLKAALSAHAAVVLAGETAASASAAWAKATPAGAFQADDETARHNSLLALGQFHAQGKRPDTWPF